MATQQPTMSNAPQPKTVLGKALTSLIPSFKKTSDSTDQSTLSLKERLAYRSELKEQLTSAEHEAGQVRGRTSRQQIKLRQVRDELSGLKAREKGGSGNAYPGLEEQIKAAETELDSLIEGISADELRLQALHSEIGALRNGIQQISQGAAVDEVKEHLQALQAAEDEVARFEALVRNAQAVPVQERPEDDALDALQLAREDLLADIAAGVASRNELAALDAEIQEILSDSDGHQATALGQERDNAQALAGLKRRLSAAQARRDALIAQSPEVIEQLLIARAEAVAEEYLANAQALQLSCRQLQGIAELLTSAVPGASKTQVLSGEWSRLMIPTLPLQALREAQHTVAGNEVLYSNLEIVSSEARHQARQEQLELLEALGLAALFQERAREG